MKIMNGMKPGRLVRKCNWRFVPVTKQSVLNIYSPVWTSEATRVACPGKGGTGMTNADS